MTQQERTRERRRTRQDIDRADPERERRLENVFDKPVADKEDQGDSGPDRDNPITVRSGGTS